MQPFTFDEFKAYAKNAQRVAVFEERPVNDLTPVMIYALLNQAKIQHGVILENLHQEEKNRYSFICFEPITSLTMKLNDKQNPLVALRHLQTEYAYETRTEATELITSAIGFLTYDAIRFFEDIPDRHIADPSLPDLLFNLYALSITFDHEKQTILISHIVEVGQDAQKTYQQAQQKIATIMEYLQAPLQETNNSIEKKHIATPIEVEPSDATFLRMINRAIAYIIQGEAFQIVLSRCFKRHYTVAPFELYKTLRQISPSPFMFYFPTGDTVIMGASPERLVRVNNKIMTVNPIAGTRKRSGKETEQAITTDLLADKKELAEHRMLVDLARNDVGTVSIPGSVHVTELLRVKHYSHISHITSTVTGQLQEKYDAFDALTASFPAGTLSGAPKIRAMQLIDELEDSRRGMYGGTICRLDSLGNLESCIAIRMAILKNGMATIRTGAGIVYDSQPTAEANETRQKASAMLEAIAQAHGE